MPNCSRARGLKGSLRALVDMRRRYARGRAHSREGTRPCVGMPGGRVRFTELRGLGGRLRRGGCRGRGRDRRRDERGAEREPDDVRTVLVPTKNAASALVETCVPVTGPKLAASIADARGGGRGRERHEPPAGLGDHHEQDCERRRGEVEGGEEAAERGGARQAAGELPREHPARVRARASERGAAAADAAADAPAPAPSATAARRR